MSAALLLIVLIAIALPGMVLFIARSSRRGRMSEAHAERVGLRGKEGLRRAKQRHEEQG